MSAKDMIDVLLGFGMFTIALIALIVELVKDKEK